MTMTLRRHCGWFVLLLLALASVAFARVIPEEPTAALEGTEDVRLLFSQGAYRIHELDALIQYGRGFGLTDLREEEPREWHRESLRIFEFIKSADDAGQTLQALVDFKRHDVDITEDLTHLREVQGEAAWQTFDFYRRLTARIAEVRRAVNERALASGLQAPTLRAPMPWAEPQREIGRKMGFTPAWYLWMNQNPGSQHAALDREQQLGNDYLLKKAAKIGIRAIVPEFFGSENEQSCSWQVVEPVEGRYDFSRIDANIDAIAAQGLKTIVPIRSLTTTPPAWALQKFGEEGRLWGFDEKKQVAAPTTGINLFHQPTRDAYIKYLTALTRHLREKYGDKVLMVTLEVRGNWLPANLDYSPAAQAHFRAWLAKRYTKIAALNEAWGSNLEKFGDVGIPLPAKEAPVLIGPNKPDAAPLSDGAKWNDWIAWRKAWTTDYFRLQEAVIRAQMPGMPIQAFAIDANSHEAHSERPTRTWPLESMATMSDFPSSAATVEPVQVLLRSAGDGRFLGLQAEQNFGSMLGGCAYTGFLKDALYSVSRDGPAKILRYFYDAGLYSYMDRQLDWEGAYGFRLKTREMGRLATTIENTRPAKTKLAVLWSENSYDQDPKVYSRYGVLGTSFALMCAKVHYDMVLESQIQRGALDNYQYLIIPEQRYLTAATLEKVRQFVQNGGTLYATSVPGMFNERGVPRDGNPLADVFGADLRAFIPIQSVAGTFLVPTRPDCTWDSRERGTDNRGNFFPDEWSLNLQLCASFIPRDGAKVLYTFADGSPAMVRNNFGKGTAIIFGYPFGHEYAFSNTTEMSFGKLYPHYSFPPQMVALERWLGEFLRNEIKFPQEIQVPRSQMARFVGRERSGPTLSYPGNGDTYEGKRVETDEPNHSFNIGLREREGVNTTYLTVFNRDSAYATARGYIHYMASPTYAIIRINRTDIKAIYDVLAGSYVPVARGDLSRQNRQGVNPDQDVCVSFKAVVPAYFGRVYAYSTESKVDLFSTAERGGISDAELVQHVAALAKPWQAPDVLVWNETRLREWFTTNTAPVEAERLPLVISYGSESYKEAAELLADALRKRGATVTTSVLGIEHITTDSDLYYRFRSARFQRLLKTIDVYIGNDYDNSNLADFTACWQNSTFSNPRLPMSLTREFPGADRAVLMTTHPFTVRNGRPGRDGKFAEGFHAFTATPSQLVIGASTPAGALRGVKAYLGMVE